MIEGHEYSLTEGAKEDVKWFLTFLQDFYGVAMIRSELYPTVGDLC